jgi:hypothetical protein
MKYCTPILHMETGRGLKCHSKFEVLIVDWWMLHRKKRCWQYFINIHCSTNWSFPVGVQQCHIITKEIWWDVWCIHASKRMYWERKHNHWTCSSMVTTKTLLYMILYFLTLCSHVYSQANNKIHVTPEIICKITARLSKSINYWVKQQMCSALNSTEINTTAMYETHFSSFFFSKHFRMYHFFQIFLAMYFCLWKLFFILDMYWFGNIQLSRWNVADSTTASFYFYVLKHVFWKMKWRPRPIRVSRSHCIVQRGYWIIWIKIILTTTKLS